MITKLRGKHLCLEIRLEAKSSFLLLAIIDAVELDPSHCIVHGQVVVQKIESLDEQGIFCKIKYNYGQSVAKL